jgi:PKD repeat protein
MKRFRFFLLTVFLALFIGAISVFAQSVQPEKTLNPVGFDKSRPLTAVQMIPPGYRDRSFKEKVIPNMDGFLDEFKKEEDRVGKDPVLQDAFSGKRTTATVDQNFAGVPNLSGVAPPDTDGDVGPNHYMQMVNLAFEIFDKNGNSLYGPADNSTLWDGFSGPWSGTNDGDPIVLYDEYADRWIASQFSLPNYPSGPFYELIAVSETGDPTGAWYRYAYEFNNMPDYPKFGVWPDGYYFTINQFAPPSLSFAGAAVCVVDRDAMISGDPNASLQFFNLGTSYGSLLPADADGIQQPGTGSPNYLANLGYNALRIWEASIDWTNSNNSSVNLVQTLSTNSYSYSGISINQPGTSQTLDALASRLMYRLQYRNFGSYEVMLTNHTVNADGNGQAGVRWYEMRNSGSGWYIYQQGTFAPADGDNRWMGSVAMNGNGDIAVGYSVSSSSTYPSIRFAGQTAANSGTGELDVVETSIVEGSTSQTGVNRWGDYSMMSVDPIDDQTFWYTTEYSNGGWNWRTQVASFNFEPPVVLPPVADFSGTPINLMEGEAVSFTDLSQNNPTSWSWSFPGGNPSSSTAQNPTVSYNIAGTYDVSLTVANGEGNDSELKTGYITVTEYQVTYCESYGTNTSKEWIQKVDLGDFSNNSGNDGGYGDYTGSSISLENGQNYSLTLTPGFSGRSGREFWRVWIDYNADGDFTDSGELVYSIDNKKSAVSGSFTVPAGLVTTTRMRVSMKANNGATSCEIFAGGEVEDYSISINDPVPQAPVADFEGTPTTVIVGNSVVFTDLSSNDPTSWSWSFPGGTPSSSSLQNPVVVYDTEGTYSVTLTVQNNEGSDSYTASDYINVVLDTPSDYCASQSNSNAEEYISQVVIGSYSNDSGASFYSDFTSEIVALTPGNNYNITLTPFYPNKNEREFWRIWIDYNGDGDFDDTGEQVFAANNKKGPVSGSFTVDGSAGGQTRMRITMKQGSSPGACESFAGGEVEDYTVDFDNGGGNPLRNEEFAIEIYPNPVNQHLHVKLSSGIERVYVRLYDGLGKILHQLNTTDHQIQMDLSQLPAGVYYLGAENGVDNDLIKFIKE